ncbi:MAG: hypothetical protein CM15mP74_25970 [Halieaceae bacterium]|nr:MAG: hypothetical protein CM15mP74_25970 [Halieaceae bacterium]
MLIGAETRHIASLNLDFPVSIPGVDPQYVDPKAGWGDDDAYEAQAGQLAALFLENIAQFDVVTPLWLQAPRRSSQRLISLAGGPGQSRGDITAAQPSDPATLQILGDQIKRRHQNQRHACGK